MVYDKAGTKLNIDNEAAEIIGVHNVSQSKKIVGLTTHNYPLGCPFISDKLYFKQFD